MAKKIKVKRKVKRTPTTQTKTVTGTSEFSVFDKKTGIEKSISAADVPVSAIVDMLNEMMGEKRGCVIQFFSDNLGATDLFMLNVTPQNISWTSACAQSRVNEYIEETRNTKMQESASLDGQDCTH